MSRELQWVLHLDTVGYASVPRLVELSGGDLLLVCKRLPGIALFRMRAEDGVVLRSWTLTGDGSHGPSRVAVDEAGNVLIGGQTGANVGAPWLVALRPDLSVAWSFVHRSELSERSPEGVKVVLPRSEGGWLVVEHGSSFRTGSQPWVLAIDEDGGVEWERTFGWEGGSDFPQAAVQVADGGHVIASLTYSAGKGSADVWLVGLGPDGSLRWQSTHGGKGFESPGGIYQLEDGRLLVSASQTSFSPDGERRPWMLWLDEWGEAGPECSFSQASDAVHEVTTSVSSEVPLTEGELSVVATRVAAFESTELLTNDGRVVARASSSCLRERSPALEQRLHFVSTQVAF